MTFGVLEVTRIPTVERRLRCLDDGTPSGSGLRHDGIDFGWRSHVVADRELSGRCCVPCQPGVCRDAAAAKGRVSGRFAD